MNKTDFVGSTNITIRNYDFDDTNLVNSAIMCMKIFLFIAM